MLPIEPFEYMARDVVSMPLFAALLVIVAGMSVAALMRRLWLGWIGLAITVTTIVLWFLRYAVDLFPNLEGRQLGFMFFVVVTVTCLSLAAGLAHTPRQHDPPDPRVDRD